MDSGSLREDSSPLIEVARNRGWSDQQAYNARRLIDGGLGLKYGFKEYQETNFGGPDEEGLEGYGWVYYLYDERVEELESII